MSLCGTGLTVPENCADALLTVKVHNSISITVLPHEVSVSLLQRFSCIPSLQLLPLLPLVVLGPTLPVGEPSDVHHEHPGDGVHGHAAQLHDQRRHGRRELTVEHDRAHAHAHGGEQGDEGQVDGVAQQAVVEAQPAQEPAALQQRVGDLAAEDDAARLAARHAHQQGQQDARDAGRVVRQHDWTLAVVAHAPADVEEEVAQAHGQGEDLELRVL